MSRTELKLQAHRGVVRNLPVVLVAFSIEHLYIVLGLELALLVALVVLDLDTLGSKRRSIVLGQGDGHGESTSVLSVVGIVLGQVTKVYDTFYYLRCISHRVTSSVCCWFTLHF